jgi:peptidoglycan/xylan/chitin deacetylase (PgdA/CDA1 family)
MAISYAGVTRDENTIYPSSKTLHSHLEALQTAGYRTITTEDALAFLEGRAPLPDKAVLILFEGARKETFIRAHPVLRKLGMRATLCVPTASMESWDESCLKNGDIRKIVAMPQWGIASMGGNTVELQVTADGRKDHFLSTRKWISREKRLETDDEFSARIKEDYRVSAEALAKLNGSPVLAYVYPYADDGRRAGVEPLAGEVNYSGVTSHYRMAFVLASNPFNPPGRSPYALTRLRVNGDWSAAQVLTALRRAQPLASRVVDVGSSDRWNLFGRARILNEALRLDDEDAAWIRGSDLWTDARIAADIRRAPHSIAVCYARMLSPSDCLRLSMDDKAIRLQESRNGVPVTLKTVSTPTGAVVRLEWRVKGLRAWLVVNDVPAFGPVPLSVPRASGVIGFESRGGAITLTNLKVKPLRRQGVVASSWAGLPPDQRAQITDYIVPFPLLGEAVTGQQCLDCIQAVAEGAEVWPILMTATNGVTPAAQVEAMVTRFVHQDLRPFIKGFVVNSAQAEWIEPLRAQGFGIMHRVKNEERMPLSVTNQMDHVWLDMTGTNAWRVASEFLRRHPPSQLMVGDERVIRQFPRVDQIMVWPAEEGKNP